MVFLSYLTWNIFLKNLVSIYGTLVFEGTVGSLGKQVGNIFVKIYEFMFWQPELVFLIYNNNIKESFFFLKKERIC